MTKFKVGIIGCGRPRGADKATGFGLGHIHANGYKATGDCEVVAAADINQENLDFFCREQQVANGYLSYQEMLAKEALDIVSVCVWPHLHAPITIAAAEAGVKAIHCEKPMAPTWGESKRMLAACEKNNVQLTLNHQRRFGAPFRKAKALLRSGAIGDLLRLEGFAANLYDWGTHWFDMMFFYNDETPVDWVIGQIDARGGSPVFGVTVEGQGLSLFQFRNGVQGLLVTAGRSTEERLAAVRGEAVGNRLIGTEGTIEVGVRGGPEVRLRNPETGGRWQEIDVSGGVHGLEIIEIAIADVVEALKNGREPELSGRRAIQATELIFATYESSRKRARIDLPLIPEDSALQSMLDSGLMKLDL